jgi:hypothetical protein
MNAVLGNRNPWVNRMVNSLQAGNFNPRARVALIAMLLALSALPWPVYATLGGDVGSIQADQANMNASQQITDNTAYLVYELQAPTGMVVREYVATEGSVFAITWQGPMLPDLRQLMGAYFAQYTQAAQEQHGGHGHLVIHGDDLIVESSGHMRVFFGRAYLPQRLPPGLSVSDIQ